MYGITSTREVLMTLRSLIGALFVVAAAGCGGSGGGYSTDPAPSNNNPQNNNPGPATASIMVNNNSYSPASRTISVGTAVQWNWSSCTGGGYGDDQCVSHSGAFDDGSGSDLQSSGSFTKTFTKAGTYSYHCQTHGAAMSGTI